MRTDAGAGTNRDVRERLRSLSEGYADRLGRDRRRRIVAAAMTSIPTRRTSSTWSLLPRMAAAAALLAVLALPAFRITPSGSLPDMGGSVRDLEVTARGGEVILTWQDGEKPHRVVRATSREELARLHELPGETVKGERWVDNRPDDSAVVFYFVE